MPIIYLNGASSSGKTSIATELQALFSEPYLNAGVDSFLKMVPQRFIGTKNENALFEWVETDQENTRCLTLKLHPWGKRLVLGMYRSIAALATSGNNVIIDEVALNKQILKEATKILAPFTVYFIGVKCPLDVLEKRESARKDRPINSARGQCKLVHSHGEYDFEVDTSIMSPQKSAIAIKKYVESTPNPSCFKKITAIK